MENTTKKYFCDEPNHVILYKSEMYDMIKSRVHDSISFIDLNTNPEQFLLKSSQNTIYKYRTNINFASQFTSDGGSRLAKVSIEINNNILYDLTSPDNWKSKKTMNITIGNGTREYVVWFYISSTDLRNPCIKVLLICDIYNQDQTRIMKQHEIMRMTKIISETSNTLVEDDNVVCILDFPYEYDNNYVNFICPRCGQKYTFSEIRRKVTRNSQKEKEIKEKMTQLVNTGDFHNAVIESIRHNRQEILRDRDQIKKLVRIRKRIEANYENTTQDDLN